MTGEQRGLVLSLMPAVPDAQEAAAWYERAVGATRLWDLGSVVGLEVGGAPFFLGEPENNGWESPTVVGTTTLRVGALESEMAQRGFEPRREPADLSVELVLERCPFAAAAAVDPNVVCGVHLGLAEGLLGGLGADLNVKALVAYPPERAGCRLRLAQRSAPSPSVA